MKTDRSLVPAVFAAGVIVGNAVAFIDDRWTRVVVVLTLFLLVNMLAKERQ